MEVAREDVSLLEALREDLRVHAVKDGCSPQGQCGCCTVLVDGAPRVSCVTPLRRVAGRDVRTVDGIEPLRREALVSAFVAHGASQCGFCTPGIICRLSSLAGPPSLSGPPSPDGPSPAPPPSPAQVENALLAHLCRCTGWRSIVDAATGLAPPPPSAGPGAHSPGAQSPGARSQGDQLGAAQLRAAIEGGVAQKVGAEVVTGRGGFADDLAPLGCLVAVPIPGADPRSDDGWALGELVAEARAAAGKVQGRRSGQQLAYPVAVPAGDWDVVLQTTWVEPAHLETDASWCEPGGEPASPTGNGGAFGAKQPSIAASAARRLADLHQRSVRVVFSREDAVRLGPKRPPAAAGLRWDGTAVLRLAGGDTEVFGAARAAGWAGLRVEDAGLVAGPAVSAGIRAAGWAEAAMLGAVANALAGETEEATVLTGEGARATAAVTVDATGWPAHVAVEVYAGDPLDEVVLRSYVQGAAHMALGWVCSEGIAVGEDGVVEDLTMRSFGILRAKDTPSIEVTIRTVPGSPAPARGKRLGSVEWRIDGEKSPSIRHSVPAGDGGSPVSRRAAEGGPLSAVKCSDAVFAAVAAATWLAQGLPPRWPTLRGTRR